MYPNLLKIGRFEIHSYGVMLAISFLLGIYWAMRRAKKRGIDNNVVMDVSLIIVFCALIGSRAMYVITHLVEFRGHWFDTINPFPSTGGVGISGLTMLGGVVLSMIAIILFCWIKKISILKLCDIMAPSFALGIFITRIGCFLNGCCYGKPCRLPWGVVFPMNSPAGSMHQGIHIHPTQLYSSFYGLIILIILVLLDKKSRFDGFLLAVFFMLYGMFRFTIDYVRYYELTVQFSFMGASFTFNQAISLSMFVFGFCLVIFLSRREKRLRKNP
jgi:phosphatidylglycerol:prolipoprotein diacylglycerol transferase